MSEGLKHVNFDIIRYANCWEDAGVLLRSLEGKCAERIAIIASAGDNALALLSTKPTEITAFDISLPQLYLSELKQMAFSRLEYDELLCLLSVHSAAPQQRTKLFDHIATHLSPDARTYWRERKSLIEDGLIHSGKFERYFRLFRSYCLPFVHSRKTIDALLRPKTDAEQQEFYRVRWDTRGWRLLMNIFFSKAVMGRAGRDPEFLKQVQFSVSRYIREKAERHLQSGEATRNHFLHYIFTGHFGAVLPHYLRPEYYDAIKACIGRLSLHHLSADEVITMQAHDAYCLSNIFEYFPQERFNQTVQSWSELLPPGALLLYWNLMVPRSFSQLKPEAFKAITSSGYGEDAGFFYSGFLTEQRL